MFGAIDNKKKNPRDRDLIQERRVGWVIDLRDIRLGTPGPSCSLRGAFGALMLRGCYKARGHGTLFFDKLLENSIGPRLSVSPWSRAGGVFSLPARGS